MPAPIEMKERGDENVNPEAKPTMFEAVTPKKPSPGEASWSEILLPGHKGTKVLTNQNRFLSHEIE